jgi:nitrous oxidase accessory protein NosD
LRRGGASAAARTLEPICLALRLQEKELLMRSLASTGASLACLLVCCLAAAPALAANSLSYVSGKGDDDSDNNCASPATPCRSFRRALTQTRAEGEIKSLDAATYGAMTIDKSITITGVPGTSIVMNAAGDAITIDAGAAAVVNLRGVEIVGQKIGGSGIVVKSADIVNIVDCVARRLLGPGIVITAPPSGVVRATISRTISSDNAGAGILLFAPSGSTGKARALIDHTTTNNNAVGVIVFPGGGATILDSDASLNSGVGYQVLNGPSTLVLGRSTAYFNDVGISQGGTGVVHSYGDNKVVGNRLNVSGELHRIAGK